MTSSKVDKENYKIGGWLALVVGIVFVLVTILMWFQLKDKSLTCSCGMSIIVAFILAGIFLGLGYKK